MADFSELMDGAISWRKRYDGYKYDFTIMLPGYNYKVGDSIKIGEESDNWVVRDITTFIFSLTGPDSKVVFICNGYSAYPILKTNGTYKIVHEGAEYGIGEVIPGSDIVLQSVSEGEDSFTFSHFLNGDSVEIRSDTITFSRTYRSLEKGLSIRTPQSAIEEKVQDKDSSRGSSNFEDGCKKDHYDKEPPSGAATTPPLVSGCFEVDYEKIILVETPHNILGDVDSMVAAAA